MGTKVRILVACTIGAAPYRPNQVVDLPVDLAKTHAKSGEVDSSKAAVDYCINELGAQVIVHQTPPTAEQLQLQSEISALEQKLTGAAEDEKAAISTAIDEKKAALAAL